MNTSLSTVDTLFNGQCLNGTQTGSVLRSSPSFNDSEPPSYFEAIGINHVNLNQIESPRISNLSSIQNSRLPKISLNTAPESGFKKNSGPTDIYINQSLSNTRKINRIPISALQDDIRQFNETENRIEAGISKPSETFLFWSIFTTVYCVFIGLPALIFSIKVYHYNKEENYEKAQSRSKIAWYLNLAGLFCGIVYISVVVLILFIPRN